MKITLSKKLFFVCLSFILGIILNFLPFYIFLIIGLIILSLFWKKHAFVSLCLVSFSLGILRTETAFKEGNLIKFVNQEITIEGQVISEPCFSEKSTSFNVKVNKEKLLIITYPYFDIEYGDIIEVKGELKEPPIFDTFNYRTYLKQQGIFTLMSFPKIERKDKVITPYSYLLSFKQSLRNIIYSNLSPPQRDILSAMLLGDKDRMSDDLKENLNIVGLRHITAVSGMHVTVLAGILMSLLLGIGLYRGQAFYFSLILIFLFIILIGFHSSAIRAGIMAGFLLLGQKLGRKSENSRLLIFVLALMLFHNPLALFYDAGFQLSFLAVAGIIYLGPYLQKKLRFLPKLGFVDLKTILAMTLAAQIFTFPILLYHFNQFPIISPLANLLVVPIVYWIILLGFIFLFFSLILPFLSYILVFSVFVLLKYINFIIEKLSFFPILRLEMPILLVFVFYTLIIFFTFKVYKKYSFLEI
ncbi:MAG: ComEC/Rec2 family competence protein [Candidatus Pacebacteria bacterium]|nr:ComEC/Rec2 family competence protein [Candidatus Paceibacterota bacterium]